MVEWLAEEFKVLVIPGAACGFNGHIRVCYSNLSPERCREAAGRLFLFLLFVCLFVCLFIYFSSESATATCLRSAAERPQVVFFFNCYSSLSPVRRREKVPGRILLKKIGKKNRGENISPER